MFEWAVDIYKYFLGAPAAAPSDAIFHQHSPPSQTLHSVSFDLPLLPLYTKIEPFFMLSQLLLLSFRFVIFFKANYECEFCNPPQHDRSVSTSKSLKNL